MQGIRGRGNGSWLSLPIQTAEREKIAYRGPDRIGEEMISC
jgi:hypothetical protein